MDCLFCKIINNEVDSYTIYEDDNFKAFLDIHPNTNGHTLIVPKAHIKDMLDMDSETYKNLCEVIKKVMIILKEKLNYDGIKVVQNNGIVQDIMHYHTHLIPVYKESMNINVQDVYNIIKGE